MLKTAPDRLNNQIEFGSIGAYFSLLKPRVMSLAIFKALCGQVLALKFNSIHPILFLVSTPFKSVEMKLIDGVI